MFYFNVLNLPDSLCCSFFWLPAWLNLPCSVWLPSSIDKARFLHRAERAIVPDGITSIVQNSCNLAAALQLEWDTSVPGGIKALGTLVAYDLPLSRHSMTEVGVKWIKRKQVPNHFIVSGDGWGVLRERMSSGHFPLELSRHDILEKDYVSQQARELRDQRYSREKLLRKTWLLCISCKKFARP